MSVIGPTMPVAGGKVKQSVSRNILRPGFGDRGTPSAATASRSFACSPPSPYCSCQMSRTPLVRWLFALPSGSAIIPSTTIGLFQCPLPVARLASGRPDWAS